jgi:taurine dioxygenase
MSRQMTWREEALERGLRMVDLYKHAAAAVEGMTLAATPDAVTVAPLRSACAERVLALFRGRTHLDPASYPAFAKHFRGRPDVHSRRHYCLAQHREIFVAGNVEQGDQQIGALRVGRSEANSAASSHHSDRRSAASVGAAAIRLA